MGALWAKPKLLHWASEIAEHVDVILRGGWPKHCFKLP